MRMTEISPPPTSSSGRWFLILVGLATALIGALFVWLMARSFLRAFEMRTWPEVECVILTNTINERLHDPQSPREYQVWVEFGYDWQGKPRIGDQISLRGNPWSSKTDLVAKRAAQYPIGSTTTCRVHPSRPDYAVLKPDSLAPGYSIWFPALFVVGGLVMASRAAFPKTHQP
jgi:hypothetical protein